MNTENQGVPEPVRHVGHRRLPGVVLATVIVVLICALLIQYRVHLFWRIALARNPELGDVRPIPIVAMPDVSVPEDWVRYRFGSLEFALPPELAKTAEPGRNGAATLFFNDQSHAMVVPLPTDSEDRIAFLQTTLTMPPEGKSLSQLELRLAWYQANPDDFRWSMSTNEVRWLVWRVIVGRLMRTKDEERAETLFRDDLEGVACFKGKVTGFFWEAKHDRIGGYITFIDGSPHAPFDPTWIRAVCRSLKFSGKSYPAKLPKEQVLAEFQIIEK